MTDLQCQACYLLTKMEKKIGYHRRCHTSDMSELNFRTDLHMWLQGSDVVGARSYGRHDGHMAAMMAIWPRGSNTGRMTVWP